jgi:ribonuclease P protein component
MDETDLSTQRAQARQDTRLSQEDVDQGRPGCHQGPPCEGTPAPVGVTVPTPDRVGVGPIRSRQTFADLRRPTGRGRSGPVAISFVERSDLDRPMVAFAVNRKVGNAVVRNLIRRRLRAIVTETPGLRAGAYLVRCDPTGPSLDFHELKVAMSQALEKATNRPRADDPSVPATHSDGS